MVKVNLCLECMNNGKNLMEGKMLDRIREFKDGLSDKEKFILFLVVFFLCLAYIFNAMFIFSADRICKNSDGLLYNDDSGELKCLIPDNVHICKVNNTFLEFNNYDYRVNSSLSYNLSES